MKYSGLLTLASRFYSIASNEDLLLPINEEQKRNARSEKATLIVDIDPLVFLELTTTDKGMFPTMDHLLNPEKYSLDDVKNKDLAFFLSKEIQSDLIAHPFIKLDKRTGKIVGHEGRHRAAAVVRAGGKWFRLAVYLIPQDWDGTAKDIPSIWKGQFRNVSFDWIDLMDSGKLKVIETR